MIEIIAFVWGTSFLLSLPITGWNLRSAFRAAKSPRVQLLNSNLQKAGLFWSLSSETFKSLNESTPEKDLKKIMKSYVMIGALGLLSFLGLLFLSIVSLSMHFLSKNRRSEKVFASELGKNPNLDVKVVRMLVDELK